MRKTIILCLMLTLLCGCSAVIPETGNAPEPGNKQEANVWKQTFTVPETQDVTLYFTFDGDCEPKAVFTSPQGTTFGLDSDKVEYMADGQWLTCRLSAAEAGLWTVACDAGVVPVKNFNVSREFSGCLVRDVDISVLGKNTEHRALDVGFTVDCLESETCAVEISICPGDGEPGSRHVLLQTEVRANSEEHKVAALPDDMPAGRYELCITAKYVDIDGNTIENPVDYVSGVELF